jgi:GAF domain-containing protein
MNIKLIRLQYRFLLQIACFILYLAVIAGVLLYMRHIQDRSRLIDNSFEAVQEILSESYLEQNNFQLSARTDNIFFQTGQNESTLRFQSLSRLLADTLEQLLSQHGFLHHQSVRAKADSVELLVTAYSNAFNQLVLTLKELGNRNTGLINQTYNSAIQLASILSQTKESEAADLAVKLTLFSSELLFASNESARFEIESILDKLEYLLVSLSDGSANTDEIKSLMDDLRMQLTHIDKLITGIGSDSQNTGLQGNLHAQYTILSQSVVTLENSVYAVNKRHTLFIFIFCSLILLLVTSLYVIILIRLFNTIRSPLKECIEYSQNLSKGKSPDRELNNEVAAEFVELNTHLTNLNDSLNEKRLFVEDMLKQKFKVDLSLRGKMDIFGKTLLALKESMRKTREEQTKHAEENQIRRYLNEGIAKFADILRSNSDNLGRLSDIFIREIVRYLEAIQGGLFLLEKEGDTELHLTAAFAYNRKKYLEKTILLGESLVGTCALEHKTINLTNIPEDYLEITSGLGDAPPRNLLIIPVIHEQFLIGVLELASLKPFDENQVTLGERIASSLASTIVNARINSQTSDLLQKSQQQAAEMAEQEEEMRQNMEELKATQEESARREEELEGILNAIDHAFYVIEYDTDGTITKVNQRLLYLINMHSDKVIGKKHNQLFGKKSKVDALLFANVAEGNTVEVTEHVVVNQIQLEMKNTFSPIRTKDGHTIKILNILTIII